MTWQLIETAPKDETLIDVWVHETRFADVRWDLEKRCWVFWGLLSEDMEWMPLSKQPAYWMPIPEGPL